MLEIYKQKYREIDYAKGGKVMTYNVGGMVKSQGKINTGIRMAKGGAMGGMKNKSNI